LIKLQYPNCSQRPGFAAVARFEFSECSGRSGVNFFTKRRAAPQSHGSKPMLPAAILDLLAYVFSKRVVVQLTAEILPRFDGRHKSSIGVN